MSRPASLPPLARATWRTVARAGRPLTLAQIERQPGLLLACRRAHDTCRRVLVRLCDHGHLVNDGAALTRRTFWWGTTCLLPAGEEEHPRWRTTGDASRALPRTPLPEVPPVFSQRCAPLRRGSEDFRAWPSRRGDRLHYADGRVMELATTREAA